MGLPAAPKVEVRIPRDMFAGQACEVLVDVVAREDLKIDFIDATLQGLQYWIIGSGKHAVRFTLTYPNLYLRLATAGVLPAGPSQYRARFTLPPDAAPTHDHRVVRASTELRVHVSIPWWPDGRYRFQLPVRVPPPGPFERRPLLGHSTDQPGRPRLEVALSASRIVAGERLYGSVALFHVDDDRARTIRLSLTPMFELRGRGRSAERAGFTLRWEIEVPVGSGGKQIDLSLEIPPDITPTFATLSHRVSWFLVAEYKPLLGAGARVTMPLEIFDRAAAAHAPQLARPPRVADQHVVETFGHIASANGWTLLGPTKLAVPLGDGALTIEHVYRGEDGAALVAQLAHPSLGLDLVVTPSSRLRHVFWTDVECGHKEWDARHHVAARDAAQAIPFLQAVVPAFQTIGAAELVEWTDDGMTFERTIASFEARDILTLGQSISPLERVVAAALSRIAPPIETDVAAWRSLARGLDGELVVGNLSIDAPGVATELVWHEGKPVGVRAHVGDAETAPEALRGEVAIPEDATATWPLDITELRVTDGVAHARCAAIDPQRTRELVEYLRGLLRTLAPGAGPYR